MMLMIVLWSSSLRYSPRPKLRISVHTSSGGVDGRVVVWCDHTHHVFLVQKVCFSSEA
jgi:hypothetical protein